MMKKFLFGVLAAIIFAGVVCGAGYTEEDLALGRKMLKELKAVRRKSHWEKPKYFVRSQTTYSGQLYFSRCNFPDRPLFNSRMLQGGDTGRNGVDSTTKPGFHQTKSYQRTIELYKISGLDGFATFAWPGESQYRNVLKPLFDVIHAANYPLMLETSPGYLRAPQSGNTLDEIRDGKTYLRMKDGSAVFSSYTMDSMSPSEMAELLKRYQKAGHPRVQLLPQMGFNSFKDANGRRMNQFDIFDVYRKHGTLPASLIVRMQEYLRSYRDVCAGLYLGTYISKDDLSLDTGFTDDVLVPIFKGVLAEEGANGEKIFAMQGKVGYNCYPGCYSLSRRGTGTLRAFLNTMRKAETDLFIGTEWDELNEDTGFEPLVGKPMSTMRILRYYIAEAKGEKVAPLPGDDLSIPNLIVSSRRQLVPGESFHLELLNVPDGSPAQEYGVEVTLLDENGKTVWKSEKITFFSEKLSEQNIELATEHFSDTRVLMPQIKVTAAGKVREFSGLPFTVLRSTSGIHDYSCTPLRNLLIPEKAEIAITSDAVSADFAGAEKIAAAEVLEDNIERFGYDPHDEFLQNDPDRVLFRFYKFANNPPPRMTGDIDLAVTGAPSLVVFTDFYGTALAKQGKVFPKWINFRVDIWDEPKCFFSVKKSDLAAAKFSVRFRRCSGPRKGEVIEWEIPLAKCGEFCPANTVSEEGITLVLEREGRPGVQALPFDASNFRFQRKMRLDAPNGVAALRVVSENGKVFWSKPFVLNKNLSSEKKKFFAYSDAEKKYVSTPLPIDRIKGVKYLFSPEYGYMLPAADGTREFFAMGGSSFGAATGFPGERSYPFTYGALYFQSKITVTKPRPDWVKEADGTYALAFDGKRGNCLAFGTSVLPSRSGFTVDMEIMPNNFGNAPELLCCGQYNVFIFNLSKTGALECTYFSRDPAGRRNIKQYVCRSNIKLETGKYQKVRLSYDGTKLTLSANGQSQSFPCDGIRIYNFVLNFGGYHFGRYFDGRLRALEIKHYPQK